MRTKPDFQHSVQTNAVIAELCGFAVLGRACEVADSCPAGAVANGGRTLTHVGRACADGVGLCHSAGAPGSAKRSRGRNKSTKRVDIGPTLTRFGPNSADSCQIWPNSTELGLTSVEVGPTAEGIGRNSVECGQSFPMLAEVRPTSGHVFLNWATFGRVSAIFR